MALRIAGIIVSYLLGSVPTAYIFGRLMKGVDIRTHGSGNVGATNAMRLLGRGPGTTVLILDIAKGFLAVVFVADAVLKKALISDAETYRLAVGLACILGHSYTLFLRFKGGKGVATSLGVLVGLAVGSPSLRLILAIVLLVWIVVFLAVRIVSLASICACVAFPVAVLLLQHSGTLAVTSFILGAFVIYRHKSNIRRLLRREEKPLW